MVYATRVVVLVTFLFAAQVPAKEGPSREGKRAPSTPSWKIETIGTCCKTCTKGKACGNTCIARDKVCHRPPGCACDG